MSRLSLKNQKLEILPEIDSVACTGLEELDLSQNNLGLHFQGEYVKDQLFQLIKDIPTLRSIDISENPLPPEIVFFLHAEINRIYTTQKKVITLYSDYLTNDKEFDSKKTIAWVLSKWKDTENPIKVIDAFSFLIQNNLIPLEYFSDFVLPNLNVPNKRGLTLLYCAAQCRHQPLCGSIIQYFGLNSFVNLLIEHSKLDESRPKPPPELFIPRIIMHHLLCKPDLAKKVLHHFLIEDTAYKLECLGNIAHNENQYDQAYKYYRGAIAKGSVSAHLLIAILAIQHQISDTSLTNDRIRSHLQAAANADILNAKIYLALFYETERRMLSSFQVISQIKTLITQNPNRENEVDPMLLTHFKIRVQFYHQLIEMLPDALFQKRVELAQKRCTERSISLDRFNKAYLYEQLKDILLIRLQNSLFQDTAYSVLHLYLEDEMTIWNIKNELFKQLENTQTPNQKLLSMNPSHFAAAVTDVILDFQPKILERGQKCLKVLA